MPADRVAVTGDYIDDGPHLEAEVDERDDDGEDDERDVHARRQEDDPGGGR